VATARNHSGSMNVEKARSVLKMIQEDAVSDAATLDGMPLTGKSVGTMFGNVLASIKALATILDQVLEDHVSS
jgi:hypothetical protein